MNTSELYGALFGRIRNAGTGIALLSAKFLISRVCFKTGGEGFFRLARAILGNNEKKGSEDRYRRTRRRTQAGRRPSRTTTQPCGTWAAELFSVFLGIALSAAASRRLLAGRACGCSRQSRQIFAGGPAQYHPIGSAEARSFGPRLTPGKKI